MLTPKMKRRIKRELSAERPTIWVGKQGACQIVNEVSRQLDQREMVKVKILKNALKNDIAKNVASKIAQKTSSTLIEVRGHTFILYRHRRRKSEKPL
ncbi:MAG: YhbY family RNA-binding protein [Candidatus Bathyarchaeota archaeon]|nr:YhbY family RNA-binding protein [Candidatus Bathyarchaeota archaeon]